MTDASKSALILIEYVNDWLSPTGGIYPAFQDREQGRHRYRQFEDHPRRGPPSRPARDPRSAEVRADLQGAGRGPVRPAQMTSDGHGAFLGEQADFFPGFGQAAGEHVVRERAGGSSVFVGTTLDGYLRNNPHLRHLPSPASRCDSASSLRCATRTTSATTPTSSTTRQPAILCKQQDDFVAEIAPFYANAVTTQEFVAKA